jgi:hypothetical protein
MLACIAITAHGEWSLAVSSGYHPVVAGALPVAIDSYAIRAMKTGREVFWPVLLMVATNAAAHLVDGGALRVSPWLVVAVSAIAPLVMWRVHGLQAADHVSGAAKPLAEVPAGPPSECTVERAPEPIYVRPEPAEQDPEPEPVDEAPRMPVLGSFTPVGELLGAVGGTSAGTGTDQRQRPHGAAPEPRPEPPEPEISSGGTGASSGDLPDLPAGVSAEHVITVRTWLAVEPELTGTEIGTRLGKSDSYGRRVKRAAGAPS